MALKDQWVDKINGKDDANADDINQVAHAVIDLEGKTINVDESLTIKGAAADALAVGMRVEEQNGKIAKLDSFKANAIVCSEEGEIIAIADSADAHLRGMTVFGKCAQEGQPSPEMPITINTVGENGEVNVIINDFDGASEQNLKIPTPNGLPGVMVSSDGNYTDDEGRQWVCDEVDFTRGVYLQRICKLIFKGTESLYSNFSAKAGQFYYTHNLKFKPYAKCLCTHFVGSEDGAYLATQNDAISSATNRIWLYSTRFGSVSDLKSFFANKYADGNPVVAYFVFAEPKELPIDESTMHAYSELRTYFSDTSIYTDGNAGISVEYVADTKKYIDRKINELVSSATDEM